MSAPPGLQQANSHQQAGRASGLSANFQPPPNINFAAPVIRLGTLGSTKPAAAAAPEAATRERGPDQQYAMGGRRAGLGSAATNADAQQRQNVMRDAMIPPTKDEIARTIFIGGITEGVGGDEGISRLLDSVGNLRRWIRAMDADEKQCRFGFAEYEDPESLGTAVEVLKDVQVPVARQTPSEQADKEDGDVKKSTLLVC